jgi:hypothetical protein
LRNQPDVQSPPGIHSRKKPINERRGKGISGSFFSHVKQIKNLAEILPDFVCSKVQRSGNQIAHEIAFIDRSAQAPALGAGDSQV